MQFVNISKGPVYTSFTGSIGAGKTSSGSCQLEELLKDIVHACGSKLGIRLSATEADLLNKLMDLDERGGGFNPASLPAHVRNDPQGIKSALAKAEAAQKRRLDEVARVNAEAASREAEINGETLPDRKPVGPATLSNEGVKVEPGMLKSGFDAIMEANAKLEAEKKPLDPKEALDPIGAHAVGVAVPDPIPVGEDTTIGKDPEPIQEAKGREDDATRSADTDIPVAQAAGTGRMDKQAAEMARAMSTLGPDTKAKKGRGRKAK